MEKHGADKWALLLLGQLVCRTTGHVLFFFCKAGPVTLVPTPPYFISPAELCVSLRGQLWKSDAAEHRISLPRVIFLSVSVPSLLFHFTILFLSFNACVRDGVIALVSWTSAGVLMKSPAALLCHPRPLKAGTWVNANRMLACLQNARAQTEKHPLQTFCPGTANVKSSADQWKWKKMEAG